MFLTTLVLVLSLQDVGVALKSDGGARSVPVDCVRASEQCLKEYSCSTRYRTMRQCVAGRESNFSGVTGSEAQGECRSAIDAMKQSPLNRCRCRRGMKKEKNCLRIFWSIFQSLQGTDGRGCGPWRGRKGHGQLWAKVSWGCKGHGQLRAKVSWGCKGHGQLRAKVSWGCKGYGQLRAKVSWGCKGHGQLRAKVSWDCKGHGQLRAKVTVSCGQRSRSAAAQRSRSAAAVSAPLGKVNSPETVPLPHAYSTGEERCPPQQNIQYIRGSGNDLLEYSPYEPVNSRLSDIFRLAPIIAGKNSQH
uniref:GDNF/GAS1 domain-containing protein n=1 Tax=Knipowitschia caucasica TaxID=637954 RepID=A0AAV2LDE5_KNICA